MRGGGVGGEKKWIFDSGATSHMVAGGCHLRQRKNVRNRVVEVVDGSEVSVESSGRVYLSEVGTAGGAEVVLRRTLLVPSLQENLISISKLDEDGYKIEIEKGRLTVMKDGKVKAEGNKKKGLYELERGGEGGRTDEK